MLHRARCACWQMLSKRVVGLKYSCRERASRAAHGKVHKLSAQRYCMHSLYLAARLSVHLFGAAWQ
eukprot:2989234-Pleurochrysis_carterae.AAC.1